MKLSPIARKILEARYLRRDESGNLIETPEELFKRVAKSISEIEKLYGKSEKEIEKVYEEFLNMMQNMDFLPNSPCLMNAGTELGQLAACFVLPIEDSMESIFETLKQAAIIHKSGGGTGFSFSRLRPKGDIVKSTRGISSGPVSFIKVFDAATEQIKQGGKRRGANMGVLICHHPDIEEFINLKRNPHVIRNFNISVAITDSFMEALYENRDFPLINPRNNEKTKEIPADYIFHMISENSWRTGDPGILYIDNVNKYNPTPKLGSIEATNPCGEQPLLPYESCVLGSINISNFVKDSGIDWERLKKTVKRAVRFLDNVIDANIYPLPQIEKMTKKTRKIGLGIMGLADAFIKLGVEYGEEKSLEIASRLMEFIQYHSKLASLELAKERGCFPAIKKSVYTDEKNIKRFLNVNGNYLTLDWEYLVKKIKKTGIRNATTTTVAPTGTISLIAGCSSGIEPIFALSYRRKLLDGETVEYIHPLLVKELERLNIPDEIKENIIAKGKLSEIEEIPEKLKKIFVTAYEIHYEKHLKMQKAVQLFVDNAVSKTINLPHSASIEDIKEAYKLAYELGLKGVTVFRDRCFQDQVIFSGIEEQKLYPRERPKITKGATIKMKTGCGNLYVTVNEDDKGLVEVFSQLGKTGGCAASQLEAISRLISLALRSGIKVEAILKQIEGIRCPNPSWDEGEMLLSCADSIAKAIKRYMGIKGVSFPLTDEHMAGICPDCGNILHHKEGCIICEQCGYTRC